MSQEYKEPIEPIELEDYIEEIAIAISDIKSVMDNTLIEYSDNDIKILTHDNSIFILANPQLGVEPAFDESGNFRKMVPLHNITATQPEDWLSLEGNQIKYKIPKIRIIRPDLCRRIICES